MASFDPFDGVFLVVVWRIRKWLFWQHGNFKAYKLASSCLFFFTFGSVCVLRVTIVLCQLAIFDNYVRLKTFPESARL